MRYHRSLIFALWTLAALGAATPPPSHAQGPAQSLTEKMNAYVGCINRLSARSHDSRARYFSWVGKNGPTGKERIIYGTYTIYDTSDCKRNVEKANALEPRDAELEAAATAYVEAVTALAPLLKEADDYYSQQDYKDDKMAKGKAMHPRLVAAWNAFASADTKLRAGIDAIQDKRALERLAEIERTEGRRERYHIEASMIGAKQVLHAQRADKPDVARISAAIAQLEETIKAAEIFAEANQGAKFPSGFISAAKSYLVTAKLLMRRIRDKVPYSQGDRMMLNAGSGWMVEGSPPRLTRDYNQLVDAYNRGARF